MKWQKCGLIYCPSGLHGWDREYAHLPTATQTDAQTLRIYFAALDENKYGRIGCVDVAGHDPGSIVKVHERPVLELGEPGTFDDSGVNPSCIVKRGGDLYLYYIGWQRSHRVPYSLLAGVAVSPDGLRFRRLSRTPILERTNEEPFIRSATSIINDGGIFRCWYVSANRWVVVNEQPYPEYVVRYAESRDGFSWEATGQVCIELIGDEFGIGRPWVIKDGTIYRMWYSIRSRSRPYRIGYAESCDGLNWDRKDSTQSLQTSVTGWDSEMICYPCVCDYSDKRYVFYNGNRHGATGFGFAVLDHDGKRASVCS